MKSELVPLNGDPPIPITRDLTVIGRRDYCDVVIPQASLSKRHCVIVRTDGLLMLRDLATTNGTKVNGQRVSWAALLPNDRVNFGGYKVRVYLGPDDVPSPSEDQAPATPAPAAREQPPAVQDAVLEPADDDSFLGFAAPTPNEGMPRPIVPARVDPPASARPSSGFLADKPGSSEVGDIFAQLRLADDDDDDSVLNLD